MQSTSPSTQESMLKYVQNLRKFKDDARALVAFADTWKLLEPQEPRLQQCQRLLTLLQNTLVELQQ